MLLFDESKALEKALGEEATAVLAKVIERQDKESKAELATKADVQMLKAEMQLMEERMDKKLERTKNEMLRWMIALVVGQIGAIAIIIRFMVK